MQRHAIIASPKQDYIRVRSSCGAEATDCQETRVFYCPDICHEVNVPTGQEDQPVQQTAEGDNAAGAIDNGMGQ